MSTRKRKKVLTIKELSARINDCKQNIAAERDKLRELVADANEVAETCDSAVQDLERAADTLSQYL